MIDLKQLREHPQRFKDGAAKKNMEVQIDRLLRLDEERRAALTQLENKRSERGKIDKELGPQMGKLQAELKKAEAAGGGEAAAKQVIQQQLDALRAKPAALKEEIAQLEGVVARLEPEVNSILLTIPLPPDADVPVGTGSDDNVEVSRWSPPAAPGGGSASITAGFDLSKPFASQRGFKPKSHIQLCKDLNLVDFPRGVKIAGTRSYVLTGMGFLLHQAVTRYAFDYMVHQHGFVPMSVPVLVREEAMIGTGFFPAGREQAYHIAESQRQNADATNHAEASTANDLFLTGTGEVGLMALHMDEIIDEAKLPLKYVTVSPCFRREAGAAGKDTAGLYRVHMFDKVEQVVICKADEAESRAWHKKMIGYVEGLLQSLKLPYRLLQCCTGDLGVKNADMIDIECWMPGRGELSDDGTTAGDFGETHSASRLYDYQCRRLNLRYKSTEHKGTTFCHSLNNTVAASPRLMIPILEMYQQADGSVVIPEVLRPYMGGAEKIG
ncbi:MAG: serine--tRNA ligase [Phycisphaerales bacterium]|nr:serine--tRNA ligase [Phycisphaerales bacterium]